MSHTSATELHLAEHDTQLKSVLLRIGPCTLRPHTNYYEELVGSIVSQQLSMKTAATIWQRFLGLCQNRMPIPNQILATDIEQLQAIGCSYATSTR